MFCPNCGTEYAVGSRFCPKCGCQLPASDEASAVFSQSTIPSPVEPSAEQSPVYSAPQAPQAYSTAQQPQVAPQPAPSATSRAAGIGFRIIRYAVAFAVAFAISFVVRRGVDSLFGDTPKSDPDIPTVELAVPEISVPDLPDIQPVEAVSFPAGAIDSIGNLTVLAVEEMAGEDICAMLDSQGWQWDEDNLLYVRGTSASFFIYGPDDYEFTLPDIQGLSANGGEFPTLFIISVDSADYTSTSDAFSALTPLVVEDIVWLDDNSCVALVYGPSMTKDLVLCTLADSNSFIYFYVFNDAACKQGMVNDFLDSEAGYSPDEIFDAFSSAANS